MYSKGYKTPGKPDTTPITQTNGKSKEPRFSKSLDHQNAKNIKSTEFPPRKRSIPLGFDFDLDEVPSNPMLKDVYKERGLESSSSKSSDNSLGASHRRMSQEKRSTSAGVRPNNRTISEDSSEEFAVDDENVFQKIETLAKTLEDHNVKDRNFSLNSNKSCDLGSGLPSAKTLRGGRSVVARGRHSTNSTDGASSSTISMPGSATQSLYSTGSRGSSLSGSGRYDGAVSPLQSPRRHNNQLTPGLGGEVNRRNRRNRQMDEQRSMSVSPSMRN